MDEIDFCFLLELIAATTRGGMLLRRKKYLPLQILHYLLMLIKFLINTTSQVVLLKGDEVEVGVEVRERKRKFAK